MNFDLASIEQKVADSLAKELEKDIPSATVKRIVADILAGIGQVLIDTSTDLNAPAPAA